MEADAFLFIVIIYAVLPLMDELLSMDWRNPTVEERRKLESDDIYFKVAVYIAALCDWFLFFKVMNVYANY